MRPVYFESLPRLKCRIWGHLTRKLGVVASQMENLPNLPVARRESYRATYKHHLAIRNRVCKLSMYEICRQQHGRRHLIHVFRRRQL